VEPAPPDIIEPQPDIIEPQLDEMESAEEEEFVPSWEPEFEEIELSLDEAPDVTEMIPPEPTVVEQEVLDRLEEIKEMPLEGIKEPAEEISEEPVAKSIEEIGATIDAPVGEEDVLDFLEELASEQADEAAETVLPEVHEGAPAPDKAMEMPTFEEAPPEELEEGLDWLERLAAEDVTIEAPISPVDDFEQLDVDEEVPDWLGEVAEIPETLSPEEEGRGEADTLPEIQPEPTISSAAETIITRRPSHDEPTEESEPDELEIAHIEPTAPPREPATLEEEPPEEIAEGMPAGLDQDVEDTEAEEPEEGEGVGEWERETFADEEGIPSAEFPPQAVPDVPVPAEKIESVGPVSTLEKAREAINRGEREGALKEYAELIKEKSELDAVIIDLKEAIEKTPRSPDLWQILGDAYMNNGQTSEALSAYRQGMESV
jgi:hypothetical protein